MNIVITGASKGIGLQLVNMFVQNKHNVVAISRDISVFEKNKSEFLHPISFDLTSTDYSIISSFVEDKIKTVDILINNAGLLISKAFEDLTDDDFDRVFNTNVKGIFKLSRVLLSLLNSNSHIVNISSMGGIIGSAKFPGLSLYSASKGAVSVLTECMAEEFKSLKVSVNALALGAVQTEMLAEAFPTYKAPLSSSEMAEYIYDFSINGSKYYNGKVLPVSLSTP
jgi:3-oxoacyl-[acyl-carrier protein] reductase